MTEHQTTHTPLEESYIGLFYLSVFSLREIHVILSTIYSPVVYQQHKVLITVIFILRFPRWGHQPQSWGNHLLFDKIFCRKLHENEINWTERGGGEPVPSSPSPLIRQCIVNEKAWMLLLVAITFQYQLGSLIPTAGGMHVTHSLRFSSGATPADLLAASMAAEPISST